MQGLINSGMAAEEGARPQPQQGGPQMAPPPSEERPPESGAAGIDADPEVAGEQSDVIIEAMLDQLYGDRLDKVERILQQSEGRPEEGIARVVSGLMNAAYKRIRQDDRMVPPGVMVDAGITATKAVGEMGIQLGVIDPANESETIESGFMIALGEFGRTNADKMSDAERQRYAELVDALEEGKRMSMQSADQAPQTEQPPQGAMPGEMTPRSQPTEDTMNYGGAA